MDSTSAKDRFRRQKMKPRESSAECLLSSWLVSRIDISSCVVKLEFLLNCNNLLKRFCIVKNCVKTLLNSLKSTIWTESIFILRLSRDSSYIVLWAVQQ